MTTNYIAVADVDGLLERTVWQSLFTEQGGSYDAAAVIRFTRCSQLASMIARTALENAGYSPGEATTNDGVIMTALSVFLQMAYGRKKLAMPEALQPLLLALPEGVRIGEVPIPDLDPDAQDGVGGVAFTDSTSSGRPAIMTQLRDVY